MKSFLISVIAILFTFVCSAQIAPPKQTDTLIVTSVRYNYADIRKENWPADVIYKSTVSFQIGDNVFNIMEVRGNYAGDVVFILSDSERRETYRLDFEEHSKDNVKIKFSGYEFKCMYKEHQHNDAAVPVQLVGVKPSFNGGDANAFSQWVNENLIYPEKVKQNRVQGRVTLQFTINEDGTVSNVRVLRGVDSELDKEAIRVVSSSPKWTPGKLRDGTPVKVTYTYSVIFQLR